MTDLENEMKEITSVLMNTQENFRVFDYLTSKFDDKDAHTVVHRSMYFAFTKNMLFDQIILGLSFLYKPKERHNLRTFINKFRQGGVFATEEIDHAAIKQWQKKIKSQDAVIDQIIVVRNSMVAHKEEKKLETSGLTKKNFNDLITIAQSIFQDIYEKLYNSEYRIDKPFNAPIEDLAQIIKQLTEVKKALLAPLRDEAKRYGLDEDGNDIAAAD